MQPCGLGIVDALNQRVEIFFGGEWQPWSLGIPVVRRQGVWRIRRHSLTLVDVIEEAAHLPQTPASAPAAATVPAAATAPAPAPAPTLSAAPHA